MVLPKLVQLSYAGVALTSELLATFWGVYMLHYLTDNAGLEPLYTGVLMILFRLWDAINDMLFGYLSDATDSPRWGKRRGWMLGGILPHAICYAMFWFPVPFDKPSQGANMTDTSYDSLSSMHQLYLFLWYFGILFVTDAGFTAVNVPHLALLSDITQDPKEKFSINLYRSIFSGLGSLLSVVCVGILSAPAVQEAAGWGDDSTAGWPYLASGFAACHIIVVLNCIYQTRGYLGKPATEGTPPILVSVKKVLKVRAARFAVTIFVVTAGAVQFTLACLSYLILNIWGAGQSEMAFVVLTALIAAVIAAIVVKIGLSGKEKRLILGAGCIIWASFYVFLPFINSAGWYLYPLAAFMGVGLAVSLVVPLAFVADAADYVELEAGKRYDGALFGMLQFFNKILLGVLVLLFQVGLQFTGFDKSLGQGSEDPLPTGARLVIRLGLGVPVLLIAIAFWANWRIQITAADLARVHTALLGKGDRNAEELESMGLVRSASPADLLDSSDNDVVRVSRRMWSQSPSLFNLDTSGARTSLDSDVLLSLFSSNAPDTDSSQELN